MKLLSWMHRKLGQNSIEPFKEFTTGNSCACLSTQPSLYELQYYPKPTFSSANSRQLQGGSQKSPSELKTRRVEEVYEEESSTMITSPFNGFLTIGTLGSEPTTEPSTPTFPTPYEKITKKETDVTENELKLINDELEKFLEAEAKEAGDDSSERSSHVSIITITGKQIECVDTEEYGDMVVCPLQGYLFGSSIELPETSVEVKKERTSLEQLFKRDNISYDYSTNKCKKGENQGKGTYARRLITKMLKKLNCCSTSPAASAADGAATGPVSAKKKLPKVLRMFHRKVHPERSPPGEEFPKSHKYEIKKTSIAGGYNMRGPTLQEDQDKQNSRSPLRAILKKEITNMNLTHKQHSSSGLAQKREHWIKTDADYLVLEL